MHLGTDTIDPCNSVRLPYAYPMDEAPELLVVIPVRFEIIVVDEKSERSRTAIFCLILSGLCNYDTYIILRSQIILPVEIIRTSPGTGFKFIESVSVRIT